MIFVNQPLVSILNSTADSIRINQDQLLSYIPDINSNLSQVTLGAPSVINQISSLGNITLDYLKSSPTSFPLGVVYKEPEIDILKESCDP